MLTARLVRNGRKAFGAARTFSSLPAEAHDVVSAGHFSIRAERAPGVPPAATG